MKKIIGLFLCLLLISGCATSHLENGDESVVKFDKGGISAQDLYEKLKEKYGTTALVELMDTELLKKEYKKNEEETKYISDVIASLKDQWGDSFENNMKAYYGVEDEKELKEFIRLSYRKNKWKESYVKDNVTDKQIDDYYEDSLFGDIEASHILIKSKATSSMSDDEKKEAEKEAEELAKALITKLNNGEKFEDLAKEYSDDDLTKNNGGKLDIFNDRSNYDENFLKAANELEVDKYSTTPVKTRDGYHIILKTKQLDKPKLKDVKESIIEKISKDIIDTDSTISTKAILALREKYGVKITDSDIKKEYNDIYGIE